MEAFKRFKRFKKYITIEVNNSLLTKSVNDHRLLFNLKIKPQLKFVYAKLIAYYATKDIS